MNSVTDACCKYMICRHAPTWHILLSGNKDHAASGAWYGSILIMALLLWIAPLAMIRNRRYHHRQTPVILSQVKCQQGREHLNKRLSERECTPYHPPGRWWVWAGRVMWTVPSSYWLFILCAASELKKAKIERFIDNDRKEWNSIAQNRHVWQLLVITLFEHFHHILHL